MQVFIVGSPLETAMALDPKRLRKQIIECGQILDALHGQSAWGNHPCVLQYREHEFWLRCYKRVLETVQYGGKDSTRCKYNDYRARETTPNWHTQEYYDQMKRRLYTKDPEHYAQWADLEESDENWYFRTLWIFLPYRGDSIFNISNAVLANEHNLHTPDILTFG